MTDDSKIATHAEPIGRHCTNFIVHLDLTGHGLHGHYEQMWTKTEDKRLFELCCIPFFTYGQSLGDTLQVTLETGQHRVHAKSDHRTIRFAFTDDREAHEGHQSLHGALVSQLGCSVEFRHNGHYGAIDLPPDVDAASVVALLARLQRAGALVWEWADPAGSAG